MAEPVFDVSKPFAPVEGETLDSLTAPRAPHVAAPATPTFDPSAPFTPAPGQSGPVFDPSKPFTPLAATAASSVYTLDAFKSKTPEELAKDKAFQPVTFGKDNLDALQNDPASLEKLRQVYVAKEAAGTTALEKAKALYSGVLPALETIAGGVKQVAKTSQKFSPQGIAEGLQKIVAGGNAADVAKEFTASALEVPASVEAAAVGTADLLRRSARAVNETPLPIRAALLGPSALAGNGPVADQTQQQSRERMFSDIEGLKSEERAGKGNGAVMAAAGVDADTLKQSGINLDPDAIQKLSVVTNPINYIPIGGAVAAVTKLGGKALTIGIASAVTAEQAAKFANVLNLATDAASKTVGTAATAAGGALEGAGNVAQNAVKALGGPASGVGLGGLLGGNVYSALGGAAVARGVPKVAQTVGKAVRAGGEILTGARPTPAALSLAGDFAKASAAGTAKGLAEGAVISLPFELGARPEEEQNILGMVGLGGVIRGGIEGGRPVVSAAGRAAQNKLAETIFKRVEQSPAPESLTYGTEPKLDNAHTSAVSTLPESGQKLVNWGRELLREAGGEVYVLPHEDFVNAAGDNGSGYAVKVGEKLNPDGTSTPLVRIFLNASAEAVPHEFFHALESLDPAGADALRKAVQKEWTPEQKNFFEHYYNTLRNNGLPESKWRTRLAPEKVAGEAAAEVFSRVFLAQDLTGIAPSISNKAALFVSSLLDKLGSPLAAVGRNPKEAGVSTLGVRPGIETTKLGQQWLGNLLKRVNETGSIGETPKQSKTFAGLTAADITDTTPISTKPVTIPFKGPKVTAATPVTPAAPAAPKAPIAPPPTSPTLPTPTPSGPRNIRTTRAAQNDFAGRRAEETGIARAREVADKSADPNTIARVKEISDLIEAGSPVVEIEHSGAESVKKAAGRTTRRAEQEAAYIAENAGAAPESIRKNYQKVFVPVRWEISGGKSQLLAMSLDKVIANSQKLASEASLKGVGDLIPYEVSGGKLTEGAWKGLVQDLKDYAANQQNGFRGDGQKLIRPTEDVGLSIPAENPNYSPVVIPEAKANFLNAAQGLNPPLTAREGSNLAKAIPGNVKGQVLAEVNQRTPQTPAVIRAEDIAKQNFKSQPGRSIKETNPLRNQLAEAGVPVRELIEVTERINAADINNVTARPDLDFQAPVTDTIRGGFLPKLVPVLETASGERYPGKSHSDALARALADRQAGKITPAQFGDVAAAMMADEQHKFLDLSSNKVLDRTEAGKAVGSGPLESEHLPAAEVAANLNEYLATKKPEGAFLPNPDESIRSLAETYRAKNDLDKNPAHQGFDEVKVPLAKKLADFYESAQHSPDDPAVIKSYQALADETKAQYQSMVDAGYTIEPWPGKGEPYKNSAEAIADARENKHLFFLKTEGNFSGEQSNPLLKPSGVSVNGHELLNNDLFRGVHDFFGHAKEGYQFGPRGEFNAWKAHSTMFSDEAQGALAAETLAQNSWVNYGKHLRDETGHIPGKDEAGYVPLTERPFAEQKNLLVPQELLDEAHGQFLPTGAEWEKRMAAKKLAGPAKEKKAATANPTAWILPDGEMRPLTTALHENDLSTNRADYAERFGTKFSEKPSVEERQAALNAGFVRMRYRSDGSMTVEIGADSLNKQRAKLIDSLLANQDKIDKLRVGVLDKEGHVVDSFDDAQLFKSEDRGQAIEDGIRGLKSGKPQRVVTDVMRARQFGTSGDFLPVPSVTQKESLSKVPTSLLLSEIRRRTVPAGQTKKES